MAITREDQSFTRFRGLSTDEKPGRAFEVEAVDGIAIQIPNFNVGSVFTEDDTGHRYKWNGSWPWVRQVQTIEAQFAELSGLMAEAVSVLRVIQAATATVANAAWEAEIPTGLDN